MRKLGGFCLQEFLARGRIEEKIAHGDRSAERQSGLFHSRDLAAVDFDYCARRFFGGPRLQSQPRYGGDGGQGLSAKPQRSHAQQSFSVLELGGCVPLQGELGIVSNHAPSVVGELNKLLPARTAAM